MASILDNTQLFFTQFEPKLQNRFIMNIDGIPSYMIRKTATPSFESDEVVIHHINTEFYVKGKSRWSELGIELYDAIVPSGAQSVMEWIRLSHESTTGRDGYADMYKKDVSIQIIGPVGDIVSEWTLKGTWVKSSNFGDLDWSTSDAVAIAVTLRFDYPILQF